MFTGKNLDRQVFECLAQEAFYSLGKIESGSNHSINILRFKNELNGRVYSVCLYRDLLGDFVFERRWGSNINKLNGKQTDVIFSNDRNFFIGSEIIEEVSKKLLSIFRKRKSNGYELEMQSSYKLISLYDFISSDESEGDRDFYRSSRRLLLH